MVAFFDFCHGVFTLFITVIQTMFEIVECIWSNPELRQWLCDSIAESPLPLFIIVFVAVSLGGGISLNKSECRQLWRAADTFCTARDISRWFRQK